MATFGYLESAYLVASYLSQVETMPLNTQLQQQIISGLSTKTQLARRIEQSSTTRTQLDRRIDSGSKSTNAQMDRRITSGSTIFSQLQRILAKQSTVNAQLDRRIDSGSKSTNAQMDRRLTSAGIIKSQLDRRLGFNALTKTQLARFTSTVAPNGFELGRGSISHEICSGYLIDAYLMVPYLGPQICAHIRQSLARRLEKTATTFTQISRKITTASTIKTQIERKIFGQSNLKMQLLRAASYKLNTQILRAIYNTTNLRIMAKFPSRGTSGTNWAVIAGGTTSGDFGVNNVNTDIVEQAYRSTATTVTIQCDTGISQGIFNDTLAILAHNMSRSASVILQGSNDVSFSSIPLSENLNVEEENIYWISEFLPLTSYRYWRIVASDPTNASGYIQMGTIVFGPSIIFNGECFVDTVSRRKTHFSDRIRTEGYSSVSNDRALKRAVGLSFQKLNYLRENYGKLSDVVDYARTSLKCLWIPTPQTPSRFAVFGKLSEMPIETHKAISATADYIDMDVNVDEAL